MKEINAPTHTQDIAGQVFNWANIGVRVKVEKLNNNGDCELYVFSDNGQGSRLLRHTTAHLLSTSHTTTITRQLKKNIDLDWDTIFTYITHLSLTELRKGEPVIQLDGNIMPTKPEYLLYPLFVKDAINTIYADRSSAKTLFITMIDLILTLPWIDNPLELDVGDKAHNILFLDYENNPSITDWTAHRLRKGMDIEYCPIQYRHCSLPLAEDISQIKNKIVETKADTIIIDSIGMAVGDDLNLTKPAFQFFSALRQLEPITTILIGHTAKNLEGKRKTVYGNAYYENEARNIWEIKKTQELNSPELNITLYHRKPAPFAQLHEDLAYRFTFEHEKTLVSLGTAELDSRTSTISDIEVIASIIANSDKPLLPNDIYDLADQSINRNSIGVYLKRLSESRKITKTNEGYVDITNSLL